VVATSYLLGVSTRRMEKLVETLGITRLSRSQVSRMAADLDAAVEAFRTRPLDAGPYTFVAADALVLKVREGGRVVNVHALVATGVNADGHCEVLGLQVTSAEGGAGWLGFFRDLTARGLSGVRLVTSDAHAGLVAASVSELRMFRRICYEAAQRTGGRVVGFRISDDVTPNFHQGVIAYGDRAIAVVCVRDAALLAIAVPRELEFTPGRDAGPLTFVDLADLAAALTEVGAAAGGYRLLTAGELDAPVDPARWPSISSYDLRFWTPSHSARRSSTTGTEP
jgi:hypothetical protein